VPLWGRGLGPHLTQCRLGQVLPAYQDMGQKLEDCDFWGGRAGSPSNTYVACAETYPHAKFYLDLIDMG